MLPRKLITIISSAIEARSNCLKNGNEYAAKWDELLDTIQREYLPSGCGIDSGTTIDVDDCNRGRVVLNTAYHHMNEGGYYDGWTEHRVIVSPEFDGITIDVKGRNRNDIKDYLAETLDHCLNEEYVSTVDGLRRANTADYATR